MNALNLIQFGTAGTRQGHATVTFGGSGGQR